MDIAGEFNPSDETYQRGYQTGYKKGREKLRQELATKIEADDNIPFCHWRRREIKEWIINIVKG